jgi:hypothetical protein
MNTKICEQKKFVKNLVNFNQITMKNFFKIFHDKFYLKQDISFMEYFLELSDHKEEFIVHHDKLIEYGIMSSVRFLDAKERLEALGLIEGKEYLLQWKGIRGSKQVYYILTPAFKKYLMRSKD